MVDDMGAGMVVVEMKAGNGEREKCDVAFMVHHGHV